jgi:cysteinyl-tRNA synthetase
LKSAASSIEKLRNFRFRLTSAQLAEGANPAMAQLATETVDRIRGALEDDLNTAQAQAALFDMARKANAALDAGEVHIGDVKPLLSAIEFDEVFGVLKDDDQP